MEKLIEEIVKEFDEKFKPDSHEFLEVRGVERDTYVLFMGEKIKSHLTSSIKKAVEEAYEDLVGDVEKMVVPFCKLDCGAGHELKANILSLIEKKKSEFLNK